MEGPAYAALVRLTHSLGDDIDETVLEYLCSVLQPEDLDSTCLEDVVELLAGACPAFGSLPTDEQTDRVLALLDEVASAAAAAPNPGSAVLNEASLPAVLSSSNSAELVAAQMAQLTCSLARQQELVNGGAGDVKASTSGSVSPAMQPEVQELLALCPPGISPAFMLHVLRDVNNCDPQAAVDWILDCGDICRHEQAWLDRSKDQELDKERQKQAILERFDLQAVPEVPTAGCRRDKALDHWGRDKKQKQQEPQVRYRDGQCHRTKDKYIVEKLKEDWDGGSTGKVYTKGKRGKGFV